MPMSFLTTSRCGFSRESPNQSRFSRDNNPQALEETTTTTMLAASLTATSITYARAACSFGPTCVCVDVHLHF